ncbi:MAG: (Fe-S)-binding protein [Thermodesulfobacteriota bacterium]|nr:(Fe-S)-binding protein [Thermodesulfobacteriota bacterium]
MNQCAKCGACTSVCPIYRVTGRESLTARGKHHLINRLSASKRSSAYPDIISKCLLCGACNDVCPRFLDTPALVITARHKLGCFEDIYFTKKLISQKALSHLGLVSRFIKTAGRANEILIKNLPADSGLRLRLLEFAEQWILPVTSERYAVARLKAGPAQGNPDLSYFTGCAADYLFPEIGSATEMLLQKGCGSSLDVPATQACCGLAAQAAGDLKLAKKLAKTNIAAFEANSLPIFTSCASCYSHLKTYPDLLEDDDDWKNRAIHFAGRLQEFSTYFVNSMKFQARCEEIFNGSGSVKRRVIYHDPCHLKFGLKIIDAPRRLLARFPGIELMELPHGSQCCGHGGLFSLLHPGLSHDIRDRLITDFESLGADTVVTTCSGCLLQWRQGLAAAKSAAEATHLGVFLAKIYARHLK